MLILYVLFQFTVDEIKIGYKVQTMAVVRRVFLLLVGMTF